MILDAHALMAFFEKEPGFEIVKENFVSSISSETPLLMTSVNYGEVLYIIEREFGPSKAEDIERTISTMPIEIVDVDRSLAKIAAHLKASFRLSYADCFAAALANLKKGELITGDREFDLLKDIIKIRWI
jgi:ribonuclease VapC